MGISLGVLCAFARDSVTRAATRERQKRVSRQGAKLAKAKLTEDRPNEEGFVVLLVWLRSSERCIRGKHFLA
jgi:hypothetical protein